MAFAFVEEENTRGSRYSGSGDPRAARPRRRRRGTLEARGHRPRGGKAPGLLRSSRMPPLPRRRRRRGCTRYSVSLYHRQRSKIPNVVATCERARVNSFFCQSRKSIQKQQEGFLSRRTMFFDLSSSSSMVVGRLGATISVISRFAFEIVLSASRSVRYRVQQW